MPPEPISAKELASDLNIDVGVDAEAVQSATCAQYHQECEQAEIATRVITIRCELRRRCPGK